MSQLALAPSLGSSRHARASKSWLSPALVGAMLFSSSVHAVPVLQAIRDLVEMRQFINAAAQSIHDYLWTTYEVEAPPPPPKAEEEKPKEPDPEPAPLPAPKPIVQPKVTEKPPEAPPKVEPPPAAAQAGKTLTAPDNAPVDFSNDFTMVQGDGRYAGGTTASKGKSDKAVEDPNARADGTPGGKGTASAAPPPPPPQNEPDRSRPAAAISRDWSCSHLFPAEADSEGIDNATVQIVVTVRPDGSAQQVKVLSDPGHGFGRAARICALSQKYNAAFDRSGQAISGSTAPITVRFTR